MAHILVVDDDPHIQDVICHALEKAGHTFTTASDGQEALDNANAEADRIDIPGCDFHG